MNNKVVSNEAIFFMLSMCTGIYAYLTATRWAKFADKRGNTFAAIIATFGMSTTPFLYVLSESLSMLVVFNIVIGFSITGTALVLFNLLLDATPKKNRTTIISIYNTIIALSATVAPVIGVWIMQSTSLDISLVVTGIIRFAGCSAFYFMYKKSVRMDTV